MRKLKKEAWKWCSLYCRLRDALEFSKRTRCDNSFGQCCTCGKIGQWRYMDAGHFIGRGIGGGSGVYFDERNVNLQCKRCNGFLNGNYPEYKEFMTIKYGYNTIEELRLKHRTHRYTQFELAGLLEYYKSEYEKLKDGEK